MEKIYESYQSKYGIAEKYVLSELGGNVAEIIREYESVPDFPFSSMFDVEFSDADNIHNMVLADIQRRYFQAISRDKAVVICNVLSSGNGDGTIKISRNVDLEYNAYTFMAAWNENHRESEKIYAPESIDI